MENAILNEDVKIASGRVNEIRSNIRDLRIHYEQLMDLGQEFEGEFLFLYIHQSTIPSIQKKAPYR